MQKPAISARIDEKTKEMLERYKEEEELTTSEATQRLLRQNLNVKYGEGDILFSDGGTKLKGEIEETQNQLVEVETTVDELKTELEDDISQNNLSYLLLTAGLVYIIIQTSFSVPSSLTIPVGIGLIGGLLYVNLLR
jgi:antitoxin component of RelBE/YafQ-DinJ toxin-antitoxin module